MGQSTRLYGVTRASNINIAAQTSGALAAILPALQTILGTTETVIADPGILTNALIVAIEPGGPCEQEEFQLLASGYFNLGTSSTVTLRLYSGTSLTPGSNTLLKSSGASSAFSGKAPWKLKAILLYDSVSGQLTGTVEFLINNVVVAAAAVTNVVTGVNNANNPVLSFVISVQFSTAGTQVINVKDFGINH